MTNREIAQEISNRIGTAPVPFDSVYSIALQIYNELGGEQTQFDSVYSILLEILPLVEGGGKPIEEVSELPEAYENKDKLYRLDNGEKDVYAAKLLSSETITTNRLPDEQQIDKAYIYTNDEEPSYYKGMYHIIANDGETDAYVWRQEMDGDAWIIITLKNAETITNADNASDFFGVTGEEIQATINEGTRTVTLNSMYDLHSLTVVNFGDVQFVIPATYNAPESAQIGNAYLKESNWGSTTFIYEGLDAHLVEIGKGNWYRWRVPNHGEFYTTKPASEIYYYDNEGTLCFDFDVYDSNLEYKYNDTITEFYIPQLNAPDSEQVGNAKIYDNRNDAYYVCTESVNIYCRDGVEVPAYLWVAENPSAVEWSDIMSNAPSTCYSSVPSGLICNEDLYYDYDNERWISIDDSSYVINFLGTKINHGSDGQYEYKDLVKYQRTETTEEWGWQDIIPTYASDSDIDDLFSEPTPTGNKFYLLKDGGSYGLSKNESFVHTAGDTVDYNGQTCYRWYKQEDSSGDLSADSYWDDNDMYMLTNTLNIHLPFNKNSAEFVAIISNDSPTSYLASFGKDDFVEMIIE